VRGDEGIGAGEQVVRDHDGDPVFDVGVACPNFPRRERRRRGRFLEIAGRVDPRDDDRIRRHSARFVRVGRRLPNHRNTDRLEEQEAGRGFVTAEDALRRAGHEERIEECPAR